MKECGLVEDPKWELEGWRNVDFVATCPCQPCGCTYCSEEDEEDEDHDEDSTCVPSSLWIR